MYRSRFSERYARERGDFHLAIHRALTSGRSRASDAHARAYLAKYAMSKPPSSQKACGSGSNEPSDDRPITRRQQRRPRPTRSRNRCSASPMQSLAALASTAASRRTSAMRPKYWLRCCLPPSCCTHHMHAEAAKSCGQAVRFDPSFSCGHEAGSRLKRCLPEMVPEAVTTGSQSARPSRSTSAASGGEMGAAALRRVGCSPVARSFEAILDPS